MPEQPTWRQVIEKEAQAAGVPPALAFAIVDQESSGNPAAVGQEVPGQGRAQGFFQLMPATAQGLGVDPSDPYQNVKGGIALLSQLHQRYGNDVPAIVAGYHGGTDLAQHGPKTEQYVKDVLGRLTKAEAPAQASSAPQTVSEPVKAPAPSAASDIMQGAAQAVRMGTAAVEPTMRFGTNMAGALYNTGAGLVNAVRHPIDTAQAIGQNFTSEIAKARQGNPLQPETWLPHVVSAVAPQATEVAQQAESGDWAGAAGKTAGYLLAPKVIPKIPGAIGSAARGVGRTATAVMENPLEAAAGAALSSHLGPVGMVGGGILAAKGMGALHGGSRAGVAAMIARRLMQKAEKAAPEASKVAPGTEVAAESPLAAELVKRQAAQQGIELPTRMVLTPEEILAEEQRLRAIRPLESARGHAYAAFGKGGAR